MKFITQLFSAGNLLILQFIMAANAVLLAQSDDKLNITLAKTAFENHGDYERAEKYLNQVISSSPFRDSIDFLLLDLKVNMAVADSSKPSKPGSYKKAMDDAGKLYTRTQELKYAELFIELQKKYDKSTEKIKSRAVMAAEADSIRQDSLNLLYERKYTRVYLAGRVLHKPSWHVGVRGGFNFDYFNFATQKTSHSTTTINNAVTAASDTAYSVYRASPGLGLTFGAICHPYISDYVAVGVHCDGVVGTTPLIFNAGGDYDKKKSSKYSNHTTYMYGALNYGIELTAGFAWLKLYAAYDHSLRHSELSYFEDAYSTVSDTGGAGLLRQNGEYKFWLESRHEEITVGLRLFPYSKDKLHIQKPCLLDAAYIISRDYDFAWKSGKWSYRALNNFYHGVKLSLWVESRIGFTTSIAFPKNYYKEKNSTVDNVSSKTLPFITASIYYNLDFFGLGHKPKTR